MAAALTAARRGDALVELIADGVHVGAEVVRMTFDLLGPERILLVSDAMSATGLGNGEYRIGSLDVWVRDGVARLVHGDSIAGSTTCLPDAAHWAEAAAGIAADDVMTAARDTPRTVLLRQM